LRAGFVAPHQTTAILTEKPSANQHLRFGPLMVELRFFGDADPKAANAVFGQFCSDRAGPSLSLSVAGYVGHDFLFVGDVLSGMSTRRQTVPAIKAIVTEEFCNAVPDGFVAHGALVSSQGRSVFLSGEPGAGKATLTLALTTRGFEYGSDDIVQIGADGMATGIPFAAAAKSGGWDLLKPYLPQLCSLPIYERPDAQLTRYVLPESRDQRGPRPIDIAIVLNRREGAETALEPLSPVHMLCVLLECGYSQHKAIAASTLKNLARNVARARSFRLTYDGLAGALTAIERLVCE
jgi:subtilisin family serine protease